MSDASEQRSDPRFACLGQVAIDRAPGVRPLAGRLIDLSLGGCRIAPGIPGDFPLNTEIEFVLERADTVFRIRGSVKSIGRTTGEIGIQFIAIPMRGKVALQEMIEELRQSKAPDRNLTARVSFYNAA